MQKFRFSIFSIILVICLCTSVNAFNLRLQWTPQTQFAGYYMSVEKGFYKDMGLDIKIEPGGPGIFSIQEIADKNTDFATSWLVSAVRMRANGVKLIHIGQVFQKSALMLIAKKTSGIDSIQKFPGHTWESGPEIFSFCQRLC